MELVGTIREEINEDRCCSYDNPKVYLVQDDGTKILLDDGYLEYNELFKDFRDRRIRIVIEEVGET